MSAAKDLLNHQRFQVSSYYYEGKEGPRERGKEIRILEA
jgi:hypothetical protein